MNISIGRWLKILVLSGITASFLCACNSNEKAIDKLASTDLTYTDLTYTDDHVSGTLCDGVTVDADIPDLSAVTTYDIVSAYMKLPDDETIQSMKNYLFAGYTENEIKQEQAEEYQLTNFYIEGSPTQPARDFAIYNTPGARGIFFYNFEAYPYTRMQYSYALPIDDPQSAMYPFAQSQETDLPFMNREDAVAAVEEQLTKWEITTIGDPLSFTVDGATVYELLMNWKEQGFGDDPVEGVQPEELDCYHMIFDVGYNNIPYTYFDFGSEARGDFTHGAILQVHFTKKGIVQLDYTFADYAIDEVLEKHDKIISLDQAMGQVQKYYGGLLNFSGIHIPRIYFQYIPTNPDKETGVCILVPAWIIQPATYSAESEIYLDRIAIQAITGEIIN